jgi:hypothetical protein
MALRQNKKISELPVLSSTSLDVTYIVGISGSTTYKILGNQLTSSLNINTGSLVTTSSFNQYTASVTASVPNGTISGSAQITAFGFVSSSTTINTGSFVTTSSFNSYTASVTASVPNGTISGSSQLTSSLDTRYLTIGGDGVISGSSQLTSSYDTRYALSASFVSSSTVLSIQTISSASYAALTPPVSGTLYIIIG